MHICTFQTLPYNDPFPEEQSSPVYSGSYTGSPPERFRNEFQFSLGAPLASPYKSNELPMVYLNKGQFYPITLHGVDNNVGLNATKVKVSQGRHCQENNEFFWFEMTRQSSWFVFLCLLIM